MTQSTTFVGPRGWAALTLAGGSVLAVPFLRPIPSTPQADSQHIAAAQSADARPLTDRGQTQSLHDVTRNSVLPGRQVHGTLPTTHELAPLSDVSQLSVPDWAQRQSKLDALMAREAAASVPELSIPEVALGGLPTTSVAGMKPWTSDESRLASREPDGRTRRPVLPPSSIAGNNLTIRPAAPESARAAKTIVRQTAAPSGMHAVSMPETNGRRVTGYAPGREVRPAIEVLPTPHSVELGAVLPDATMQDFGSVANPPRKPNFVFQPGMRRE